MPPVAVFQDPVYIACSLRRRWFRRNTILCEKEGWSLTYSGSTWRVDRYEYREGNRTITLSGEGAADQMDIFIFPDLCWDDAPNKYFSEEARALILKRVTAALQWAGFDVGFFEMPHSR